jgi:hypothetical protein
MIALVLPLTLALALAAPLAEVPEPAEPEPEPWSYEEDEPEESPRLDLTLWGGQAWTDRATGTRSELYGAEATWRFDSLDLGLFGGAYELRSGSDGGELEPYFAPVYLVRLGQRFETRNGLLASFTFGVGTAKTVEWRSWFQVALGARATFGPAFVAGELAFESDDLIRLALGLGVSLF